MSGSRTYIHEFVDIRDHNRANYFQHITANWSPIGQRERGQLCFGIWGTVGSTARWPEVINLWEYRDWEHLADNFRIELDHPTLQDPSLEPWWSAAVQFRRGGFDRILVAPDWSPGIEAQCATGPTGAACYAHEMLGVAPGAAPDLLELVREEGVDAYAGAGASLVGAFRTAMVDDSECILVWGFPDWATWGRFEHACDTDDALVAWRRTARDLVQRTHRFLLVDAPLSPLRTGRQPRESDRTDWTG